MDSLNDRNSIILRILGDTPDFSEDLTMPHSQISFDHENSESCTTMSDKTIDDLPDLCLLAVFSNLSLIQLYRNVRLVNTRWSQLVLSELNRRRSLLIVDDCTFNLLDLLLDKYQSFMIQFVRRDDGRLIRLPPVSSLNMLDRTSRYPDDAIVYNVLHNQVPPEMVTTLVDNLPRIRNLIVVQRFFDLSALDQIARMIDHWRDSLVSLKLYLHNQYFTFVRSGGVLAPDYDAQLTARTLALFESINRATALKHLKIKLSEFNQIELPFNPPLTILSQLATFDIRTSLLKEHLSDSLVRYATGNRDLQIGTNDCPLRLLLGINPELCDRFVDVQITSLHGQMFDDFNRFCARFSSLVHLNVDVVDMPVTRMGQCLFRLTQLVHLSLNMYTHPPEDILPEQQQELPPDQIIPVPSVRLLTMLLLIRSSHNRAQQLHLHAVFPNVQALSLEIVTLNCTDCALDIGEMNQQLILEHAPQIRQCVQLTRQPFRHFPRLKIIQVNPHDSPFLSHSNEKRFIKRDEL